MESHLNKEFTMKNILIKNKPLKLPQIQSFDNDEKGRGFWKFNTSHLDDTLFVENMQNIISESREKYKNLNLIHILDYYFRLCVH